MNTIHQDAARDIVSTVKALLLASLRHYLTPEQLQQVNSADVNSFAESSVQLTLARLLPESPPGLPEEVVEGISEQIVAYGNAVAIACQKPTLDGHELPTQIRQRIVEQLKCQPQENADAQGTEDEDGDTMEGLQNHPLLLWYRTLAYRVEEYADEFSLYNSRGRFADVACDHIGTLRGTLEEVRNAEAVYLEGTPAFWVELPPAR